MSWWWMRLWVAVATLCLLVFLVLAFSEGGRGRRLVEKYRAVLERALRALYAPRKWALRISQGQGILLFVVGGLGLWYDRNWAWIICIVILGAPWLCLHLAQRQRTRRLEGQVEGFLNFVARALVAAPSLGEAMAQAVELVESPLREELREFVREMQIGMPIERALERWSERTSSTNLRMALLTLRIGRRTGGGLGSALRTTAESLREMSRLEGVLRTKTAEAKTQSWVISVIPFPLLWAIDRIDPHFFRPLEEHPLGVVIVGLAVLLWCAAAWLSHRILAVDL